MASVQNTAMIAVNKRATQIKLCKFPVFLDLAVMFCPPVIGLTINITYPSGGPRPDDPPGRVREQVRHGVQVRAQREERLPVGHEVPVPVPVSEPALHAVLVGWALHAVLVGLALHAVQSLPGFLHGFQDVISGWISPFRFPAVRRDCLSVVRTMRPFARKGRMRVLTRQAKRMEAGKILRLVPAQGPGLAALLVSPPVPRSVDG